MMRLYQTALVGMISIFSLTILFHLLVLTGIIPYAIVWGGNLQSPAEMYRFEAVSILLNIFFLLIVLVKGKIIQLPVREKIINILFWVMCALFALNTIGNLFATNKWEMIIFTPITLLLSFFSAILARSKA